MKTLKGLRDYITWDYKECRGSRIVFNYKLLLTSDNARMLNQDELWLRFPYTIQHYWNKLVDLAKGNDE